MKKLEVPSSRNMAATILDAVGNELEHRNIPGMIATFEKRNPGGLLWGLSG